MARVIPDDIIAHVLEHVEIAYVGSAYGCALEKSNSWDGTGFCTAVVSIDMPSELESGEAMYALLAVSSRIKK